jgi:DNA adenine methylase
MISWIGGKSQISKWIIPFIPRDIKLYCEPFGGAFWVYLKMDIEEFRGLERVIYNDFNDYLVNLFMSCKDHSNFYDFVSKIPSQDREKFLEYQKSLFTDHIEYTKPDFDVASGFAYLATQVWSGIDPGSGRFIDLKGKYKSKFDTFKDKLKNTKYTKNLERITDFENLDFELVVSKYDSPDSFFYVDAPYHSTEHYYSNHDFGENDHIRLANSLKSIKGRFAMSYYYFPQLEEWFPKGEYNWQSQEFSKSAMASKGKSQTKGMELLIMNY